MIVGGAIMIHIASGIDHWIQLNMKTETFVTIWLYKLKKTHLHLLRQIHKKNPCCNQKWASQIF